MLKLCRSKLCSHCSSRYSCYTGYKYKYRLYQLGSCRTEHSVSKVHPVKSVHLSSEHKPLTFKACDTSGNNIFFDLSSYVTKVKQHRAKGLPIIHHTLYVCQFPIKHRFCMRKFHGVLRFLRHDGVISMKQVIEPDQISAEECEMAHDPAYISRFFSGETSRQEQRATGFVWSPGLVQRCRYETGGTVLACHVAKERGIACSTGGGTHHAFHSHGSGYCLINDMAIAATSMIENKLADRVLIVDLDVHQGDGTASILSGNHRTFTLSLHCQSNFPFKKQSSDLDIGLQDKLTDKEYLRELEDCLPWVVDTFQPDLCIFDAGVDPHKQDELGRLCLTDKGLYDRDLYVLNTLVSRGIPVATVIGGGYSHSLDALSRRHTIIHRAASKVWVDKNL